MKIILTLAQLKRVLTTEPLRSPIMFKVRNLTKKDMEELAQLLKKKG